MTATAGSDEGAKECAGEMRKRSVVGLDELLSEPEPVPTSRQPWHACLEWLDMARTDLLQGTLDMLVLRAVADEALHGYALVHRLKLISGGRLDVPQGSLYPALHRLENQGALKAEWRVTDTGREAKFYKLTTKGRRRLDAEVQEWKELSVAIGMILQST